MTKKLKPEIVFTPGCFDNFEGSQEELNELIADIKNMIETGEFFNKATPVDLDELDDDILEQLALKMDMLDEGNNERKLH